MSAFAVDGHLPEGVTVLEASAGTGKTYAIAGLAARYVAEGLPPDALLLVTFTRMATGELRERVRERLGSVERGLRARAAGGPASEDPVVEHLATRPPAEQAAAAGRLAAALADFDATTVATTHAFCQEMLAQLGVAGELEPGTELREDVSDQLEEVLDDLYVLRFRHEARPAIRRAEALAVARAAALDHPAVPLIEGREGTAATRSRLADAVRRELGRRLRRLRAMTYDDLLLRLNQALHGPSGEAVAGRLRERFRVVLVDEFQDTDPVQWSILRRAFGTAGTTLVLIADPKQAIYAFRGADVYAYLDAVREAGRTETLTVNWRSDALLLAAYDALFADAQLGHPGIVYRTVEAAPPGRHRRLHGAPRPEPLRLRLLDRTTVQQTGGGLAQAGAARAAIAADLAADVAELLSSGAQVECVAESRRGQLEPVTPAHLAVLVRKNNQATLVREALEAAGIPAVTGGAGSVFGSPAARHWLRLLEALEMPQVGARARAAALTPFLGWSAARLAAAGPAEDEALHLRLHEWARVLRERGVAALLSAIAREEALPERVLARADGERAMTDLRHVGELLHGAMLQDGLGVAALTAWLRHRLLDVEADSGDDERSRRLESDSDAVQVLTVHRSKGLEFPIVFLPFAWDSARGRADGAAPVCFHDAQAGDERRLDVTLEGADYRRHAEQSEREDRGEELRLLYVALTRARHQTVVWWAGAWKSEHSALGRLLFARDHEGHIAEFGARTPSDAVARERFGALQRTAPRGAVGVETAGDRGAAAWSPPLPPPSELRLAELSRGFDLRWRRTSYSDITALAHDRATVASEPEEAAIEDEPAGTEVAVEGPIGDAPPGEGELGVLPLAAMPVGATVGTVVHEALEATDFTAADLRAELRERLEAAVRLRPALLGDLEPVVEGLAVAIETPLDGFALRDVARADRLDELGFELPLAGGEVPSGTVTLAALADTLRAAGEDDALSGYAARLTDPGLREAVRGYLTGFIDLVVRRGSRFHIVDYKTNWLAAPGEALSAWHYRPEALGEEMRRRHYGLQALFYAVALHRYLRWRLADYDPARHLGSVHYAFLRGMAGGPAAPPATGVFTWAPRPETVVALSEALDRGR